jgi:hypothetical protein
MDGRGRLRRNDQGRGPENSRRSGPIAGQAGKQDSNNEFKHRDSFGLGSGKIRTVKLKAAKHRYATETSCRVGIGSVLRGASVTPRRKPYVSSSYGRTLEGTAGLQLERTERWGCGTVRYCYRRRRVLQSWLRLRLPASWAWISPPLWLPLCPPYQTSSSTFGRHQPLDLGQKPGVLRQLIAAPFHGRSLHHAFGLQHRHQKAGTVQGLPAEQRVQHLRRERAMQLKLLLNRGPGYPVLIQEAVPGVPIQANLDDRFRVQPT